MQNTKMDARIIEAFAGDRTPKFLATASPDGVPNIAPVISLEAWDETTLIFGELMIWKTKANLLANPKVGVSVLTDDMNCWTVRGVFQGFERTGERFEKISMNDMFRYNAYTGVRNVGVIEVESVRRVKGMASPARLLELGYGALRARGVKFERTGPMPPQVTEKFSRVKAAKHICYVDSDGYPLSLPSVTMFPTGHGALEFGAAEMKDFTGATPALPLRAAAAIITSDPVAYQIKGTVSSAKSGVGLRLARLDVEDVYSSSPPVPGKRINIENET